MLRQLRSSLQLRDAHIDVFGLHRLRAQSQDVIRRASFNCGRHARVHREFQQRRDRRAGSLLETGDRLTEGVPAGFAVVGVELRVLQPDVRRPQGWEGREL